MENSQQNPRQRSAQVPKQIPNGMVTAMSVTPWRQPVETDAIQLPPQNQEPDHSQSQPGWDEATAPEPGTPQTQQGDSTPAQTPRETKNWN